jgi:hypothetical protein
MYVHRIQIKNVRGFGAKEEGVDLELARPDGTLPGWTVVAGRNGTGKTTLLRAMALSLIGPLAARTFQESFEGWIREGEAEGEIRTLIDYDVADRFVGSGKVPAPPFWTGLRWERQETGPEPRLGAPLRLNPANRARIPERGPWSDNPRGWFVAGYGPLRRLSGHASDAQRLMSGAPRIARLVTLFREDASLTEAIEWLREIYFRALDFESKNKEAEATALHELQMNVLRLLDDGLLPDGVEIEGFDADGLRVRHGGVVLPLKELSDGYRTVIALVFDLVSQMYRCFGEFKIEERDDRLEVPYRGVVLIDEVDAHLHISWQQRIGFWLKEHFPAIQFIVTTHSPFICQAADPNGLIRMRAPGEDRPTDHVSKDLYYTVVNGGADDAVLTELFGLEHTHSDAAEQLREQISQLEAAVLQGEATKRQREELKRLEAQMPSTPSAQVEKALLKLSAQIDATAKAKP